MGRVKLCSNREMFYCFFQTPTFMKDLIPETIAAKKSFRVLGDHLAKCLDVHIRFCPFEEQYYTTEEVFTMYPISATRDSLSLLHHRSFEIMRHMVYVKTY